MPPNTIIIDLLSSPEVRPPTLRRENAPPAKVLSYKSPKSANHELISLSSDDEHEQEWPVEDLMPQSSGLFGGSNRNFDNLDESKQPTKSVPSPVLLAKAAKPVMVSDFGFLDEDFDNTINFDSSMVNDLPPAKKQRLHPSPEALQKPKTGGYTRSLSNIESVSKGRNNAKRAETSALKRAYTTSARLESDPIVFTSSPDHVADAARKRRKRAMIDIDSDGDLSTFAQISGYERDRPQDKGKGKENMYDFPILSSDDDSIVALDRIPAQPNKQSSRNGNSAGHHHDSDFMSLSDFEVPKLQTGDTKPKPKFLSKPRTKSSIVVSSILDQYPPLDTDDDDVAAASGAKSKARSKPLNFTTAGEAIVAKTKADIAKAKAAEAKSDAARAKKAAKEVEREEKREEREKKAREKQKAAELANVNTLRTDKKLTTTDMIVEIPSCLEKKLLSQTKTFLEDVKASFTEWDSLQPIVKWKRKIVAEWNEDEELWYPVSPHIKSEKHIMYVMTARELVQHVTGDEGHDLNTLVATLKSVYDSCKIIFLIEGVAAWYRRNKNIKNKEFIGAVRSHGPPEVQPTANQKKKAKEEVYVDEELVEEALLELQLYHGFLIHHTGAMPETAQWIKLFTENISSVPYKKTNLDTGFCMETGQVKTGEDTIDIYTKMLQEMKGVTLPVAIGVANLYPTVQQLVKGFEKNGPFALEDCRKSANKDGAFTDRRVGQAISKRIHDVFIGIDPAKPEK